MVEEVVVEAQPEQQVEVPEAVPAEVNPAEPVEVEFPKKAKNALNRKTRQIGELKARLASMEQQLAQFQSKASAPEQDAAPKVEDFKEYPDFLDAKVAYQQKKGFEEFSRKQQAELQEQQRRLQQSQWVQQRGSGLEQAADEFAKQTPDYFDVLEANQDILDSAPAPIVELFLHMEPADAVKAFYGMAKDGTIETLGQMSVPQAALAIARSLNAPKPITKAPPPLASAKGRTSTQTLASMDAKKLMEWANS